MKRLLTVLALSLLLSGPAFAADSPRKAERRTPVLVELEGTDNIGNQLFNRIQSRLESANPQNPARETRFRVLLSTSTEFPTRPGVGSVYSAVWTCSPSAGSMEYYLVREVGVVTMETMDEVVGRIINRTDGVLARYGYLDRDK